MRLLPQIETVTQLDDILTHPTPAVVEGVRRLSGDLLVLGAGGKMGPSLCKLARRAADEAGGPKRVLAVSRFSDAGLRRSLDEAGVDTVACDLLDEAALDRLPDAENILYLVGMKFGAAAREAETWAVNAWLPARVAQRFRDSRLVIFSSGNVYPLVPVASGGCKETDPPGPVGEYAQSVLARERLVTYFSQKHKTPVAILRLNYANDLRYGVLLDIAQKVYRGEPIDLRMGYVNVVWQGDANAVALRAFVLAASPPCVLNLTGPETVAVRELAETFGEHFGKPPVFDGVEADTALLSNAEPCWRQFGPPTVSLQQMIAWMAHWVEIGGPTLGKPTRYEVRDGRF